MGNRNVQVFRAGMLALAAFVVVIAAVGYSRLSADRPTANAPDIQPEHSVGERAAEVERAPSVHAPARRQGSPDFKFNVRPLTGRAYAIEQNFEAPVGDAADVIARLLPLAKAGDEMAAFGIYRKMDTCRVELMLARQSAPNTAPEALVPPDCQSVPIEQWQAYSARWLEASAERGFVPAQLLYGSDPEAVIGSASEMLRDPEVVASYRKKAMTYLHRAASTGNADALQRLARAYSVGVLTQRDPALAYAYSVAGDIALQGAIEPELAQAATQQYAQGLSRQDIERATQQGREIYEKCCSR